MNSDVIIIGAGPGGYETAIYAAKKGLSVTLFEQRKAGGTCLHEGCIPTKCLCRSAEIADTISDCDTWGFHVSAPTIDFQRIMERKNEVVAQLTSGIEFLLKHKLITYIPERAELFDAHTVISESGEKYTAAHILIATGSAAKRPPIEGCDLPGVLTSTEMLDIDHIPQKLCIIGAGVIGLEFASMYASFGSEVTVFEGGPVLMPREDRDVADSVRETLEKKGIVFRTGADVLSVRDSGGAAKVSWRQAGEGRVGELEADAVLIAAGRRPATEGLNLEAAGVKVDSRGAVIVDDRLRTSNPNIRAIGDVKGGLQFTYISLDDYRIIRDDLFGAAVRKTGDRNPVAYSVFIDPPLSHIGITEETARRNNLDVRVNRIAVASIPRMRTIGETDGLLKAVIDARTNRILGCTLFCPESSEVINTVAVAMKSGRTAAFLRDFVFTHPSVSEALNDLFV